MEKLQIPQAVIVEGKYDKIRLEAVLDAFILPVGGFSVFSDKELTAFLRKLAADRGLLVLTDSDASGFKIRGYLSGLVPQSQISHAYIPDIYGKERRKKRPSSEGKLGVEGMDPAVLRQALERAGIRPEPVKRSSPLITRQDLYLDGFWGGQNSRRLRQELYARLGLPARLNINACLAMLNAVLTAEQYRALVDELIPVRSHPPVPGG